MKGLVKSLYKGFFKKIIMKLWVLVLLILVIALSGCTQVPTTTITTTTTTAFTTTTIHLSGFYSVHFINVSQGDSILVKIESNYVLVDCGDNTHGDDVVSYLESKGITNLDYLITTHPDADHIGGCDTIMNSIAVNHVWDNGQVADSKTYTDYITLAKTKNYTVVYRSTILNLDGLNVDVISPPQSLIDNSETNVNSVVLLIKGIQTTLLTGDCDAVCEQNILASGISISSDLLKIGHHGSQYSTTDAFLDAVKPSVAVISVGTDNKYGHPAHETLDKLIARNITIRRTDLEGNIVISY